MGYRLRLMIAAWCTIISIVGIIASLIMAETYWYSGRDNTATALVWVMVAWIVCFVACMVLLLCWISNDQNLWEMFPTYLAYGGHDSFVGAGDDS
jgi:hypothetical protein